MFPIISLTDKEQQIENLIILLRRLSKLPAGLFSKGEKTYLHQQVEIHKKTFVYFNRMDYRVYVYIVKEGEEPGRRLENARKAGDQAVQLLNEQKAREAVIFDVEGLADETLAFAEGMALGSYQFLKYKTDQNDRNTLEKIEIYSKALEGPGALLPKAPALPHREGGEFRIGRLNILTDAVFRCRDLINEPNSWLTATVFSMEVQAMAEPCGVYVEVMNKKKIETMKMGGLLGVNQGSLEPPTFTVMEWAPDNAVNKKPVVLIGKGVVYDSGGMNLKPGDSMLNMKDDMSGAAAVATAIFAIATAQLPVHVVGLMPATDNRPGDKALVPGDIIHMHYGNTVEVVNTDAEGRLILADALSYAHKYDPALVIDLATLTGSAVRAIGKYGAAAMQSKATEELELLKKCGNEACERLVEFPLWEEYADLIKSDLADLKNCGPAEAGLITAGAFLQKFTGYPWIHLDIAGPAFLEKRDSYRGMGGTGFGVRLLFDFIVKFAKNGLNGTGTR